MKRFLLTLSIFLVSILLVYSWGFWAHKRINKMACFTLPPEMFGFYKKHIDFITAHAVDPDRRRHSVPEEAPRHFINIDHYGTHPFDSIPKYWKDAVAKYSEDSLNTYGILPWYINLMLSRLTDAFKEGYVDRIIYLSANIGHYIADAHVPLHCTENYNGQMTNQIGIHAFWESRLPELYGEDYDYLVGHAHFISKPQDEAWEIVEGSFVASDSVLSFERILSQFFADDQKYVYEQRGSTTTKVYSGDYSDAYNKMLDGMVERRLRQAIIEIGSFWYTAWVNAGSPDLKALQERPITEEMENKLREEEQLWKTGKLKSKGHEE
jgi:hypothetical protein